MTESTPAGNGTNNTPSNPPRSQGLQTLKRLVTFRRMGTDPNLLDVLIVGTGFSGVDMMIKLHKQGLSYLALESGPYMGGVWQHHHYPGARADCEHSIYQLNDPLLYKDFQYPERYPTRDQIMSYFDHVDKVYKLSKDIRFNTTVKFAEFSNATNSWRVEATSASGTRKIILYSRFLILCIGWAAKPYVPEFPGMSKFRGDLFHTANWPQHLSLPGKRVGIIGTGSSGVQIIESIASEVEKLVVYQRTPNIALPLRNTFLPDSSCPGKGEIPYLMEKRLQTFAGMTFDFIMDKNPLDLTQEERNKIYETLWTEGGFRIWLASFIDQCFKENVNLDLYNFWAEKTRERIQDSKKKDVLAPLIPPHPFGSKYPALEQSYYETFNLPHVDLIDLNSSSILEITEKGIKTKKEGEIPLDLIILATGFDALTAGMTKCIEIKNGAGQTIQEKWKTAGGVTSTFGFSLEGFPNLFYLYGPQGPTAFCNGPTCIDVQNNWILELLVKMKKEGKLKVEATREKEKEWTEKVRDAWNSTLFPKAKSWYQGSNIPGKKVEAMNWSGGLPTYIGMLEECKGKGYEGFLIQ